MISDKESESERLRESERKVSKMSENERLRESRREKLVK